jgi:hypothetical protein
VHSKGLVAPPIGDGLLLEVLEKHPEGVVIEPPGINKTSLLELPVPGAQLSWLDCMLDRAPL